MMTTYDRVLVGDSYTLKVLGNAKNKKVQATVESGGSILAYLVPTFNNGVITVQLPSNRSNSIPAGKHKLRVWLTDNESNHNTLVDGVLEFIAR